MTVSSLSPSQVYQVREVPVGPLWSLWRGVAALPSSEQAREGVTSGRVERSGGQWWGLPDQLRGVEEPGQVLLPQAPGQTESQSSRRQSWRGISWRQPQFFGGGAAGVWHLRNLGEGWSQLLYCQVYVQMLIENKMQMQVQKFRCRSMCKCKCK